MKFIKTLLIVFALCVGSISFLFWDLGDRVQISSLDKTEQTELSRPRNTIQENYKKEFTNPKFIFPREETSEVKIYKNTPFISRFTGKTLDKKQQEEILNLFNNPDNFSFGETTWALSEAEYIIRFFNTQEEEIGKVWLCLEDCGMTKSIPFSPRMKFGGLSEVGKEKIKAILNNI